MKFVDIQGDLYDYNKQKWIKINTLTDTQLSDHRFRTPGGVTYLINPNNDKEYKYTSN